MGIKDAFDPRIEERCVNDIVQKAVIVVDEEKTEAAAVTATDGGYGSAPMNTYFVANHPFMYFIMHSNGSILFAGSFITPED